MSNANGSAGLRVGYEQTRVFGYMGEVTFFTGDVKFGASKCIIKAINADLMATVNFAPLFYKSTTRRSFFEPRFFAGFGVNHICGYPSGVGNNNDLISKLGLDLGFNVGRNRHVYVFLQPAINYNLDHYSRTQYNINYSALQLAVGAHFRFPHSKGKATDKPTGSELAESTTILTNPTVSPVTPAKEEKPEVKPVTPAKEEKPEVKPVTPAKEEKPEVKPVTPAKEEKPEVKPVTPAKEEKPEVRPVTPAKEEKSEVKPVTPAKEESPKVVHQKPVMPESSKTTATETKPKVPATKTPNAQTPATKTSASETKSKTAPAKCTTTTKTSTSKRPATTKTSTVGKKEPQRDVQKEKAAQIETDSKSRVSSIPSVKGQMGGLSDVATFLKTHPKSTVIIRGEENMAQEARNQLVRRYNINLNRITIKPDSAATKLSFEVEM